MRALLSLIVAVALTPAVAGAQVPGVSLQLIPKIGVYLPASDLGEAVAGAEEIAAELESDLGIGLAAELDLPFSPLNFRAGFDYATGTRVAIDGFEIDGNGPEVTVLALAGDLVYRPLPRIAIVQPYLLGGAGIKIYDFDFDDAGLGSDIFEDDENDFTLHFGAGVDVTIGPAALLIEVSDYLSWFSFEDGGDSEAQHDFFAMLGLRVSLF